MLLCWLPLVSSCLRCGVQRGASALQGHDPGEPSQRPRPSSPALQRPRAGDAHRGRRALHARHHRSVALAHKPKAAFAVILMHFLCHPDPKVPPRPTHTHISVSSSSCTLMFRKIMFLSLASAVLALNGICHAIVAAITGAQLQVNLFVNNNELSGNGGRLECQNKRETQKVSILQILSFCSSSTLTAADGAGGFSWSRGGNDCCFCSACLPQR